MGASKIGSYFAQVRNKRKEAAEEEKRKRLQEIKNRPEIIDPSYEILGYRSPAEAGMYNSPATYTSNNTFSPMSASDDWLFQDRTATQSSRNLQFEPYCEVTPKSSVSSNNSSGSDVQPQHYDMGWDTAAVTRPRPQSYLPNTTYSYSMTDLNRGNAYQSKRQTTFMPRHQRQDSMPLYDKDSTAQSTYRLESSLSRPFSVNDPLESLTEPLRDSHFYHQDRQPYTYNKPKEAYTSSVPPYDGRNVSEYRDDLVKRGYRV